MSDSATPPRRGPRVLSPQTKWEVFLQVTSGEISQADAARKWQVDVSTVIGIRATVKDAAMAALAVARADQPRSGTGSWRRPGPRSASSPRPSRRRRSSWRSCGEKSAGASGPLPARVPAEVKELVLKTVDEAVAAGFVHGWAVPLWRVSDDRVHRWRARRREVGTLVDRAPGGNPVHGILAWEVEAVLAIAEEWGEVDRSHRKLAHRGSYIERVWVSPSTFRRVLAAHGLVLPDPPERTPGGRRPWPEWLQWLPNRIWIWDVTHFGRAKRAVFAIVDMVSRRWIDTLVSVEETSTQVQSSSSTPWRWRVCSIGSPTSAWTWTLTTPAGPSCWRCRTTAPR